MGVAQRKTNSALFDRILSQLAVVYAEALAVKPSIKAVVLEKAILYISEQISNPKLSSHCIASQLGLSNQMLVRLFKRSLGVTPNQFVLRVRLIIAKEMLASHISVGKVAARTGFTSANYFTRKFKSYYGCVPTSVRLGVPVE